MRLLYLSCVAAFVFAGCAARTSLLPADVPTHTLTVRWQRLVEASDKTCLRCGSCGDTERRTVSVIGQIYEAIPAALIVRPGLLAAAVELRNRPQPASGDSLVF